MTGQPQDQGLESSAAIRHPHLLRAIELSQSFLHQPGLTPFGAVVVRDGIVLGEGISSVIRDHDPTAHAEVNALRAAATATGYHLLPGSVMYSSTEPCPLCLAACMWAQVESVICAASSHDAGQHGFDDERFYEQLARQSRTRELTVIHADLYRSSALAVLDAWDTQDTQDTH
ncbi:MAG: nucleoside deaminase [Mycobacteriales bacterium]